MPTYSFFLSEGGDNQNISSFGGCTGTGISIRGGTVPSAGGSGAVASAGGRGAVPSIGGKGLAPSTPGRASGAAPGGISGAAPSIRGRLGTGTVPSVGSAGGTVPSTGGMGAVASATGSGAASSIIPS